MSLLLLKLMVLALLLLSFTIIIVTVIAIIITTITVTVAASMFILVIILIAFQLLSLLMSSYNNIWLHLTLLINWMCKTDSVFIAIVCCCFYGFHPILFHYRKFHSSETALLGLCVQNDILFALDRSWSFYCSSSTWSLSYFWHYWPRYPNSSFTTLVQYFFHCS